MFDFFNRQPKDDARSQSVTSGEPTSAREHRDVREDKEIVFSKSVKAGKRLYFLDVRKDRRDELFLSVTESKCKSVGDDGQRTFEKHKIFLYKEDFTKFEEAFAEVLAYVRENSDTPERPVED